MRRTEAVAAWGLVLLLAAPLANVNAQTKAQAKAAANQAKAAAEKAPDKNELPANVREMVQKQLPGGTIAGAEAENEDGRHLYYVKVETAGKQVTLLGSGRAQYLGIVAADDDPTDDVTYLDLATAPEAVRGAITKLLGDTKVNNLGFEVDKERFFYVAEYDKEGKTHFATFTLQGDLTEEETDIALADLPAAVQAGVTKARPTAKIDSASEVVEKKKKSYAVDVTEGGKKFELMVSEAGAVESTDSLDDSPATPAGGRGAPRGK